MNEASHAPLPLAQRLRQAAARRIREPAFWRIQIAVALISAVHIALEAGDIPLGPWKDLPGIHHMPVILYLAPVAYAALIYGWEGGVLTGWWSAVLASANLPLWHRTDFEWVLELVFVGTVVGMGVVMALPVERERQERQRAEAAAKRLAILNELTAAALPERKPGEVAAAVLSRLVGLMEFEDAGVMLWRRDESVPVVALAQNRGSALSQLIEERIDPTATESPTATGTSLPLVEIAITTEGISGCLIVVTDRERSPDSIDAGFLTTVGHQLAVRIENVMLHVKEQTMLSTYVSLVTQAQEEERRRLARDLHDGPAQRLALLTRSLEGYAVPSGGTGRDLHQDASEILGDLRRVARDQRPTLLDDLGLVPALEWLVSELQGRTELDASLTVHGSTRRLSPETEVAFYRIAQEAMRNTERHAHATSLAITVSFSDDEVVLQVVDDGTGFSMPRSPGEYIPSKRLGLMGMHERAQLVGGSLDFRETPGGGTTVVATAAQQPAPSTDAVN
ncbi:signal transduction histidine-protein kinase/phosphatase DegS [bacterium BMS3Bbin02]|nr:signal transduction histidine-protein kinase/phosphatase DegS [bacterium BMS3Bbin02]